ncbi:MAG: hypothetical protein GTO71_03410 [Woeseiaceae bacterium]|nr:hypothetical protein [Woeseiaceae bacterium]NIP20158.1 hypothetical protein [Woeseiaceae bacterium]NIS88954.1 hypothetical protein [Woeseiaceae bacterium]
MIRLLLLFVIALVLPSCDRDSRELVLVRPASEIDQEIAESLVGLMDDESSVAIKLSQESLAGAEAVLAIAEGRADVALISNDQPYRQDIATVMPLYATVFHIVHLGDREANDFTDLLRNAGVYAGEPGSASRRVFQRLTASLDLGEEPYRFLDRSADVDLAVVFAPISPDRLAEYPDVKLWSIGTPEQIDQGGVIDSLVLLNPHFRPFVIPVGTYGDATATPIVTIAVDKIIVARTDLDQSVVYDLINEMLRLRPALGTIHPGLFQQVEDDFDVSRSRFAVHPGTQDYLQRSEPTFVERYSGVAEVLVTLMIAAISASIAGVRIYARRRKNRIDRFYTSALEIQNRITPSMDVGAREQATTQLRELQDEAFALLVDEKLAADESFRIFMALCNDVLRQLQEERC